MKRYEYQVSFFLNKEQNKAFTEYCTSKNVVPYIAGRDIVKDFMMSTEDAIEQAIIKDDHEGRVEMLENRVEAMGVALRIQVEKCEKLEEEIAALQDKTEQLDPSVKLEILKREVDDLRYAWTDM